MQEEGRCPFLPGGKKGTVPLFSCGAARFGGDGADLVADAGEERGPEADALGLALELGEGSFLALDGAAVEQAAGGLGDQDVVARLARDLLDAGRGVDRVADDGELDVAAAAHRAG